MVVVDSPRPDSSYAQGQPSERSDLLLRIVGLLHDNGESTDDTLSVARWLDPRATILDLGPTSPTNINMNRVVSTLRVVDDLVHGKLTQAEASGRITTIAGAPPAPTWLFTLAAVAGSAALSLLFGVEHVTSVALVALSAGLGAILRRAVARLSSNALLQPFCAALVAGLIGGLAVRFNLSSSLRLVALCPCLILVPGPHFLNGAMDLISARISLGLSRLVYATMVMLAISVGLLAGLWALGESIPVDPPGRAVPWWLDLVAAAVAVFAYSVYYSTPPRMWPWPMLIGTLAHGLRFLAIGILGASVATGAFVACLLVGLVMSPVARRARMPFAAVGFASVVSMLPGSYLFRMASGVVQLGDSSAITLNLLSGTISDGVVAIVTIVLMSIGLIVPKLALTYLERRGAVRIL